MDLNLEGRTAVVTGASKGIGFQTALRLAQEGCHIQSVKTDESSLEDVFLNLTGEGIN